MTRLSPPWPDIIHKLANAFVAAARDIGVRGGIRVYETTESGETFYVVAVRVPASETVMSRAMKPPR